MRNSHPVATIKNGHALFWQGMFSNFYPCTIIDEEITFHSSEQMFMYGKAILFNDENTAQEILKAQTPKEAKALGRKVNGFDESTWNKHKVQIMRYAVREKFLQNESLLRELVDRKYDELHFAEASPFDRIWGIGFSVDDAFKVDQSKWGQNLLGRVLDEVRDELLLIGRNAVNKDCHD